jgi:hypothetical protein
MSENWSWNSCALERYLEHSPPQILFSGTTHSEQLASQSEVAYTRFLNHVTHLCNTLYTGDPAKVRSAYHIKDIALVKQLLPEEMYCGYQGYDRDFELELEDDLPIGCELMFTRDEAGTACVDEFDRDVDEILSVSLPAPPDPSRSAAQPAPSHHASNSAPNTLDPTPASTPTHNDSPTPASTKELKCTICDYIPTGEEKWKASNLRRHKRTQHSSLNDKGRKKVWKCKWPGCESVFTRSDNLRSHARDKGHEVGKGCGELKGGKGKGKERAVDEQEGAMEVKDARESAERPAKRRKGHGSVQLP